MEFCWFVSVASLFSNYWVLIMLELLLTNGQVLALKTVRQMRRLWKDFLVVTNVGGRRVRVDGFIFLLCDGSLLFIGRPVTKNLL